MSWKCLVILIIASGAAQEQFEHCKSYVSFGYGYKDYFPLNEKWNTAPETYVTNFELYVMAISDAHVLLSNEVAGNESIELVIGGGSNTFSQIRMRRNEEKKTILTRPTEKILSEIEYRRFRVSVDKQGIIGVRLNDTEFLKWKLENLFPIKYVSFGSWTNTVASWKFACDQRGGEPESKLVPFPPLLKLKRQLLFMYNSYTPPVEHEETLIVSADFDVKAVNLDMLNQLTMHGIATLKWHDNKLRWNPETYSGITTLFLPPFQIWTPFLTVIHGLNVRTLPLLDMTATGVVVTNDGTAIWRPPFNSVSLCNMDLKNWPYDTHNCSTTIGFLNEPNNLILDIEEKYLKAEPFENKGTWKIMAVASLKNKTDNGYGIISVKLERNTRGEPIQQIIDVMILHVLMLFALWFSESALFLCIGVMVFVWKLYVVAIGLRVFPREVPNMVCLGVCNVGASLILPVAFTSTVLSPTTIALPSWITLMGGGLLRYGTLNKKHVLFRSKIKLLFIFIYLGAIFLGNFYFCVD